MQTAIYYLASDEYLIKKSEGKNYRQSKSKIACLLSILEQYFEIEDRMGKVLSDLGAITSDNLNKVWKNR